MDFSWFALYKTFPAFIAYFGVAIALLGVYTVIYLRVTPYPELQLIGEGNTAAAASLGGALLGFVVPLGSVIAHSAQLPEVLAWGGVVLVVQLAAYRVASLLVPGLAVGIQAGQTAQGVFLGILSVVVGILNAACMVY